MKSLRASMMIPLFGFLASLAACSGQAPAGTTGSTANEVNAAAQTAEAPRPDHGPRGMHGPASLVFSALHAPIGLSDAQRSTIEASLQTLKPKAPPAADTQHVSALAAAVRAGNIDVSALQTNLPKPDATAQSAHEAALAQALTTLHATLSPDQRTALVAWMQNSAGDFHGKKEWKGGAKKHEGTHAGFGPMHLLDGLDLSQEQKDAIHAKLAVNEPAKPSADQLAAMKAQHEAMRKEMDARLQTFVGDAFDAKAFLARPKDAPAMGFEGHRDQMLKDLAIVVPLLTPAQRETLAQKIEQGPAQKPGFMMH